jgi:hypothetical protein
VEVDLGHSGAMAMTKDHSFDWDTPVDKVGDDFRPNLDRVSDNAPPGDFFVHRGGLRPAADNELDDLGSQRKHIVLSRLIGGR